MTTPDTPPADSPGYRGAYCPECDSTVPVPNDTRRCQVCGTHVDKFRADAGNNPTPEKDAGGEVHTAPASAREISGTGGGRTPLYSTGQSGNQAAAGSTPPVPGSTEAWAQRWADTPVRGSIHRYFDRAKVRDRRASDASDFDGRGANGSAASDQGEPGSIPGARPNYLLGLLRELARVVRVLAGRQP